MDMPGRFEGPSIFQIFHIMGFFLILTFKANFVMLWCFYCHSNRKKSLIILEFYQCPQFLFFFHISFSIRSILKCQMEFGIRQKFQDHFVLHLCFSLWHSIFAIFGTFLLCCRTGCKLVSAKKIFCCSVCVVSALPHLTHKYFSSFAKLARKFQNTDGCGCRGGQQ